MRKFKILVVDDELEAKTVFKRVETLVRRKVDMEFDVLFDFASNAREYDPSVEYDMLIIDYKLRGKFGDISDGNEFIRMFRKKNRISKVIFISTAFRYRNEPKDCRIALKAKDIYDLINIDHIDGLVDKNNLEMLSDSIIDNLRNIDILSDALNSYISMYDEIDLVVTGITESELTLQELMTNIRQDTELGKVYKKQLLEILITMFIDTKE